MNHEKPQRKKRGRPPKAKPTTYKVVWVKQTPIQRFVLWAKAIWEAITMFPDKELPEIRVKSSPSPFSWLAYTDNTTWTKSSSEWKEK